MKRIPWKKIASFMLVLCLFVSVFTASGMFSVKAANDASGSITYYGDLTDVDGGFNGAYDTGWQWVDSPDPAYYEVTRSGNTFTATWDSSVYASIQLWIGSNTVAGGSWGGYWPSLNNGDSLSLYNDDAGFTTTAPSGGSDGSATITYAGSGSDFGACYTSDWYTNNGAEVNVTGNVATFTWDTASDIGNSVWGKVWAEVDGSWPDYSTELANGAAITLYDDGNGGLTTTAPTSFDSTFTINYNGTRTLFAQSWGYCDPSNGWAWVSDPHISSNGTTTDGAISITGSGSTFVLEWDSTKAAGISFGVNDVSDDNVFYFPSDDGLVYDGNSVTLYDTDDGTALTRELPSGSNMTASATITYMGKKADVKGVSYGYCDMNNSWAWVSNVPDDYLMVSSVDNVYTVKWDPTVAGAVNFGIVAGDGQDWFFSEVTDGASATVYDKADGTLSTEIDNIWKSAKLIYMGNDTDTWTSCYGGTPAVDPASKGWWLNDSCSPSSPIGEYSMCVANGNEYTYYWNFKEMSVCWVIFGGSKFENAPYYGLRGGETYYIYDKDVLGYYSGSAPVNVTSSVVVEGEDCWVGIKAFCTKEGNWVNDLWIDSTTDEYGGITVTKDVSDGTTTFTYTFDYSQISTMCVEVGRINDLGTSSQMWLDIIGNRTRYVYINDENGGLTTFPHGYTYQQPGEGEGIDGDLVVQYVREDGNYTDWYFGYWYEVDGQWFNYNEKFNADGTFTLDLRNIPADKIGFVVNYKDWESKDVEEDRFITLSELTEDENGMLSVYLYSGDSVVYYNAPKA